MIHYRSMKEENIFGREFFSKNMSRRDFLIGGVVSGIAALMINLGVRSRNSERQSDSLETILNEVKPNAQKVAGLLLKRAEIDFQKTHRGVRFDESQIQPFTLTGQLDQSALFLQIRSNKKGVHTLEIAISPFLENDDAIGSSYTMSDHGVDGLRSTDDTLTQLVFRGSGEKISEVKNDCGTIDTSKLIEVNTNYNNRLKKIIFNQNIVMNEEVFSIYRE